MSQFHYDQNKLNKIFAISALLLLSILGAMFMKDYKREWKQYQTQFRQMEVEKSRVKMDRARLDLEGDPEYKKLTAEVAAAEKAYEENCTDMANLEDELQALQATDDLVVQDYKFRKAELDAAKYRYEHAKGHHVKNLDTITEEFFALKQRVQELKLQAEESNTALTAKQDMMAQCGQELKQLQRQQNKLSSKRDFIQRKLDMIDPNEMSIPNQVAGALRDLPVLELANPTLKVEQIVLNDIRDDVVFKTVPKVERCITCHLGIANPDYAKEGNPYKAHPRLDLFVGKNSPHPMEEFGCTTCHGGRPRGTTFNGAVHVPQSPEQKKEWEEKYGYHQMELWEQPMHPLQYTEAGCFKCHMGDSRIKGAEKLNVGMSLIEKAGCYACHEIEKYKDWPKPGPNLSTLASKIDQDWAYKWIMNPHDFRHNTWMPNYFHQENNSDPESVKRSQQEVHAIVKYLYSDQKEHNRSKVKWAGNATKGEELVASVGCLACHLVEDKPSKEKTTSERLARRHGPNLINIGSKTSKQWLFDWLKNPSAYHKDTLMPDMRLTDSEAQDIAAYLTQDRNATFDQEKVPSVDEGVVNNIVTGFLKSGQTDAQAKASLAKMSLDDKLVFAGEKLINHYGCYSCHNINGFRNDLKPIGAVLTYEGDKSLHKFDFGFLHDIDHSKHGWLKQKVMHPRSFDKDKELAWGERSRMPNFNFNGQQADAIVTALLGFVDDKTVKDKIKPRTPENLLIEKGQKIITQLNCTGCHVMEGDGGYIAETVTDWLVKYEDMPQVDADKFTESYSPPNLLGVGDKLNAKWLFEFLHNPSQQIRPWMKVRMPTFNFNEGHMAQLVEYFLGLDGKSSFKMDPDTKISEKEYAAAMELFSEGELGLGCVQCHVVGDKLPTGTKDSWAPDLKWAKTRLDPEWMIRWLENPSEVMPGTKMPMFWDLSDYDNAGVPGILNSDANTQIRVLRNFLLTLDDRPLPANALSAPKAKPAEATPQPEKTTPPAAQ